MPRSLARFGLASMLLVLGCNDQTPAPTITAWLGGQLHGEMRGEADGERVDVVAEASEVACKREYRVPTPEDPTTFAAGWLGELEVAFNVTVDGIERRYELEFYGFSTPESGDVWTVVPVESEGAAIGADEVHVEVQWEWEVDSMLVAYEEIATAGRVELHELSGAVGSDGLVIPAGEGNFGGFAELELPDGSLAVSFTALCGEVEVEPIEG